MKWFRLYSEFATEPKLKTFPKAQRYDLICLMCMANEDEERGVIHLDAEDIAATLEMDEAEYTEFIEKLVRKGIIEMRGETLVFTNWLARQYDKPSDTPCATADRKRKSREALTDQNQPRGVTPATQEDQSRECHANVTRSHATYSDSDSENTQKESPPTPRSGGGAREKSPKISTSANKPKPKSLNPAVAAFHERRIAQCGRSPTRKPEEEKRAGDLWTEHGEAAYRRALDGYFGCLGNSDDWPQRQGFTFIAFLRQFDRWEAGKPPNSTTGGGNRNGPRRAAVPGIVSKYQPNFRANV